MRRRNLGVSISNFQDGSASWTVLKWGFRMCLLETQFFILRYDKFILKASQGHFIILSTASFPVLDACLKMKPDLLGYDRLRSQVGRAQVMVIFRLKL